MTMLTMPKVRPYLKSVRQSQLKMLAVNMDQLPVSLMYLCVSMKKAAVSAKYAGETVPPPNGKRVSVGAASCSSCAF